VVSDPARLRHSGRIGDDQRDPFENLYNREFVDNYTNFGQYESEIRSNFQLFTPEWGGVKVTYLPRRSCKLRASSLHAPAIVPAHKKTLCANYSNASQLVHAISILNILAGTVDREGDATSPEPQIFRRGRRVSTAQVSGRHRPPRTAATAAVGSRNRQRMFSTLADGMLNSSRG
jgi:hypothetical protein